MYCSDSPVATRLRLIGGILFIANFLLSVTVNAFFKIGQHLVKYEQEYDVSFFWYIYTFCGIIYWFKYLSNVVLARVLSVCDVEVPRA